MSGDNIQPNHPTTIRRRAPFVALALVALALVALVAANLLTAGALWRTARTRLGGSAAPAATPEPARETLILVLPFGGAVRADDTPIQQRLAQAIEQERARLGGEGVRVLALPEGELLPEEREQPAAAGQRYGATVTVAGRDTGRRIEVKLFWQASQDSQPTSAEDEQDGRSLPDAGPESVMLVTEDLAGHLPFLALFALGQSAYIQDDYAPALDVLNQATALLDSMTEVPEGSAQVYFRLGWLYQEIGNDQQQAEAAYDQAIRLSPNNPIAYYNRGYARSDQGDLDGAIDDYSETISLDPEYANAYNNRGDLRHDQGDYQGAIEDYSEAIRLSPDDPAAYNNRGIARAAQGDLKGAVADYSEAIRLDPQDALPYYNRCVDRKDQGELRAALADCEEAIRLNPRDSDAFVVRGTLRRELDDLQGAIDDYTQAMRLNPTDSAAYNNRGNAFADQGNLHKALVDLSAGLLLDPENAILYFNRGNVRFGLGDRGGAIADYRRARDLSEPGTPEYDDANDALRELGFTD